MIWPAKKKAIKVHVLVRLRSFQERFGPFPFFFARKSDIKHQNNDIRNFFFGLQNPAGPTSPRVRHSNRKKPLFLWFSPPSSMAPRIAAPARAHHRFVVGGGFGCFLNSIRDFLIYFGDIWIFIPGDLQRFFFRPCLTKFLSEVPTYAMMRRKKHRKPRAQPIISHKRKKTKK